VARRWTHDLYVVTDPLAPRGLAPYLEALAAPDLVGRWALQLRDHGADDASLRSSLRLLRAAARDAHVPLLVGAATLARAELAMEEGASGVHLPERSPDAREVRRVVGPDGWIGASVHDALGVSKRAAEGVELLVVGPFRAVAGKGAPLSLDALAELTRASPVPVLALGGVRAALDGRVARWAGLAGVAVRDRLARTGAGGAAVRSIRAWLDGGHDGNETMAPVLDKLGS